MDLDTSNNNMLDSTAFSMAFAKMPRPASTPVKQLLMNSYSSFASNYSSMNKRKRQDNDGDDDDVEDMIAAAIAGKDDQNSRKKHKAWKGSDDDDDESDQASDPDDSFVKRVKQRKAAAETKKQQRWKQEMDREMKQSFETGRAIADTTYSAAVIWRAVQGRELTPDEEIIAPLIDNERAKFRALRQRNKTKYGINSNKASLEKFKDVCFAAEAVGDGKQKTRPIKRKIVIQPDSSDDEGDDKIVNAKNEHKTSSAAAMDMEPEQVEAIQAESEDDVDGEKDDDDNKEKGPTSMKERLANAWANNLIPDPNAHGFCWIMDNHEHKTIPFFKPSESKTITSYEDEEWVHVMEINPADDLAVIHGQLERAWERKSDPDLYSGVKGKDKRLRSQTMRLPGLPIPRSQISILQEAKNPYDMTKQDRILDLGTSRSCQCNKTTRDGMNWRRSDGVLDTVLMIYKEAYAICKEGSYFYETFLSGKTSHQEQTLLFQSAARRTFGGSPKDCMTRNAVLGMCRGVGAGIGEKIAYAISMKYTTPKDLIHAYDACENDDEREILLAPIKLQNSKRSVATVASTMIFEGVYGRRDSDKKSGHGKVKGKSKVESIKSKNGKKASDKQSSKKKKHKQQSEIAKKAKQKNKASNKSEKTKKFRKPKRIIVSDSDEED